MGTIYIAGGWGHTAALTKSSPMQDVNHVSGIDPRQFGRCERIRTSDPFVPNEVRYQAAPHTDEFARMTIAKEIVGTNIRRSLQPKPGNE